MLSWRRIHCNLHASLSINIRYLNLHLKSSTTRTNMHVDIFPLFKVLMMFLRAIRSLVLTEFQSKIRSYLVCHFFICSNKTKIVNFYVFRLKMVQIKYTIDGKSGEMKWTIGFFGRKKENEEGNCGNVGQKFV